MTQQTNTDSNDWLDSEIMYILRHPYTKLPDDHIKTWRSIRNKIRQEQLKMLKELISKHYIPKEEVDEMVRLAKCSHNNTTHRSTSGGGYYSDCYDCGARLMPWSLVENAQLSTNKKGSE